MAYVDLNPTRAGIATTPEESRFTSIYDRIKQVRAVAAAEPNSTSSIPLCPFSDESERKNSIPYSQRDYLSLVDWSGRAIREGKHGFIKGDLPPILKRLHIDSDAWELLMSRRGTLFGRAMGRLDAMRLHAATLGQSWVRGVRNAERCYSRKR
jgi:hypothetical protein